LISQAASCSIFSRKNPQFSNKEKSFLFFFYRSVSLEKILDFSSFPSRKGAPRKVMEPLDIKVSNFVKKNFQGKTFNSNSTSKNKSTFKKQKDF